MAAGLQFSKELLFLTDPLYSCSHRNGVKLLGSYSRENIYKYICYWKLASPESFNQKIDCKIEHVGRKTKIWQNFSTVLDQTAEPNFIKFFSYFLQCPDNIFRNILLPTSISWPNGKSFLSAVVTAIGRKLCQVRQWIEFHGTFNPP